MSPLSLKDLIRSVLPWKVYWKLLRTREKIRALSSADDLTALAKIYNTDKGWRHNYMPIYQQWLAHHRIKPVKLLEIGVGGNDNPHSGGESLRMWKKFFANGKITGIDIYDKFFLQEERIKIYKGPQQDGDFLHSVSAKEGPFDIIIDDGSHIQSHIIASFETLFPLLAPGGLYVIEDTQTSYWESYGGSSKEMKTVNSAMNYFIDLVHEVNRAKWKNEEWERERTAWGLSSIAFYRNLILIKKDN
ncbi:MAG TPA: class I SAM-dependent methyltransferase [Saprospiraceae bacterium]|nr:class I SAM-dependent methyltransferase [Saprospiraceae bacterium]